METEQSNNSTITTARRAGSAFDAAPGSAKTVSIGELWIGDRFHAYGSLWTWIGGGAARRHSPESIKLAERGYGYIGDTICSFERTERVEFDSPSDQDQP